MAGFGCPPRSKHAHTENVARFARYFHRSSAELGADEIRTYQVCLTCERKLAPGALEIAACALRFLYKVTLKKRWSFDDLIPAPKKSRRLPVVLSPDQRMR
jgi:site-specific recombinase XerD